MAAWASSNNQRLREAADHHGQDQGGGGEGEGAEFREAPRMLVMERHSITKIEPLEIESDHDS